MARFYQQFALPAAKYRVGNKRVALAVDQLKAFAANTKRMIAGGVAVPLFKAHKALGSPDGAPIILNGKSPPSDESQVGWLNDVDVKDDSLAFLLDVKDEEYANKLRSGEVKFTSPELATKKYTDGLGRDWGPVIRHVAFPSMPRNPVQGEILEMAFGELDEECIAIAFSDMDEPETKKPEKPAVEGQMIPEEGVPVEEEPKEMPTPEADPDGERVAACAEHIVGIQTILSTLNIQVPSAIFATNPAEYLGQLCEGLRQLPVREGIRPEKALKEESGVYAWSELADHPDPAVRGMAKKLAEVEDARAIASNALARKKLQEKIGGAFIPVPAREAIMSRMDCVAFSEDGDDLVEKPAFTPSEVIEIVANAIPKHLRFSEDASTVGEEEHPTKEFFEAPDEKTIDAAKAKEIVDELEKRQYHKSSFAGE